MSKQPTIVKRRTKAEYLEANGVLCPGCGLFGYIREETIERIKNPKGRTLMFYVNCTCQQCCTHWVDVFELKTALVDSAFADTPSSG